ncbi:MAG: hypothetical protein H6737_12995 [Alphaproteobacteria bacterium]|nr:hypothetical protein [Alphaproteobacteria bacterium]
MIGVLWHLHQPEYRDPATGIPVMPWTRMHALRGYRDLLVESIASGVPWTVNIVPGLWEQILYYAEGGSDAHLDLTRRPADTLSPAELDALARTFPVGHPVMRDTPRYHAIEDAITAGRTLSVDMARDLQVLSTLVWAGATARREFPALAALLAKGSGFSEGDKAALLEAQDAILRSFPDLLARFGATEGPALSTTPLHHPILPLLVDVRHAKRCTANPPDVDFAWPQDAKLQLERGRRAMAEWAGKAPKGCWPSEGSVSPEVVELVGAAGFTWLATDDHVLARSAVHRNRPGRGGWDLGHGVTGFFRDHALSDRVGFEYARWPADRAVQDLVGHATRHPGLTVVALDGENPWEAFPDAGGAFRARLIEALMKRGTTLDAAAEQRPVGRVERLHTGSWIGANFDIWAGASEDHRAWALLGRARDAVERAETGREAAMEHLLAAEGSDWFWWYGPEFDTPFADTFDAAFRAQIAAAWRAIGQPVPADVDEPIQRAMARVTPPDRPIRPLGYSVVQWIGAGSWALSQGSMARAGGAVVRYGWDPEGHLWLRLPPGVVELTVGGVAVEPAPVVQIAAAHGVEVSIDGQKACLDGTDWVV